ncbi:MAG: GTPase HflX [Treponema sp.]|nr:GTPase HflX [Spirochaetia bacterium]MDY4768989.1 GTPase HflX [Treponema sp.]
MINIEEEKNRKVRAFLVGEPGNNLCELKGLTDTLGLETAGTLTLTRLEIQPAYGMGKGKAQEIVDLAKESEADCIIFDFNIEPTKQRNWEKLSKIPCFDRQEVIIRIFASRSQTKEAVLQVELARLSYSLPRLAHSYGDMARQRGGSYGSKGAGETQLELDQRRIRERIAQTKKELDLVVRTRETQRKKRGALPVPECALIGYTNAGKSSLLNALTNADAFVENKLFATLDPLTRRLNLKDGNGILLTDTVGFISNLPHSLIDAFKSTLAEAEQADLQLIVIDASDSQAKFQYDTVIQVLKEIKAEQNNRLIVLNKWDAVKEKEINQAELQLLFPDAVKVSARTHEGFDQLSERISEKLLGAMNEYEIPAEEQDILRQIRANGVISEENWLDSSVVLKARISGRTAAIAEKYRKLNSGETDAE